MTHGTKIRMRRRALTVLIILVVFCFVTLTFRLIKLQIIDGKFLQNMASEQQLAYTKINSQRGTIYDRNMNVLAQSATVWTVVLEPAYLNTEEKRELVSDGLSKILDIDKAKILELSKNRSSYYTIVKKRIDSEIKDKIIQFKTDNKISGGIRLIEDYKRYYPYGSFAAAVLGCTGDESQGLSGIEAYYDKTLKGEPGRIVTARNARGTEMPFDYEQLIPAKNGSSLKLCIDETVQHIVEKHLEDGVINNKVKNRAAAIVMDVNNGEILGMAVKGDFNPNAPFEIADEEEKQRIETLPEEEKKKARSEAINRQWRNKAVSDTYYPGSVFKMFTASMGYELGVVSEESQFNCTGGIRPTEKSQYIRCHKRGGHGQQNFVQALCHSCNPAFIMLGQKIGTEKFFEFYKAFGFHEKTNIDLPGEAKDTFFHADGSMTLVDLAVASMGQNFSITPIQMATAICSVANGGNIVQPHVVKEILDDEGNIVKAVEPKIKRMAISKETSKRVTNMLYENAVSGAARNAYIPGFRVAGKTGTSEKIGLSTPGQKDYISSFGGFAPADNPKVAMLVFFDTPKGDNYYGNAVAAPVFAKAMQDILPYLGIEKRYTDEELKKLDIIAPEIVGMTVGEAKNKIRELALTPSVIGNGEKVVSQIPAPGGHIPRDGTVVLYTDADTKNSKVKVPKLVGETIYNVTKLASSANLNIKISGKDLIGEDVISQSQSIAEGTEVPMGTVITVNFIHRDTIQ